MISQSGKYAAFLWVLDETGRSYSGFAGKEARRIANVAEDKREFAVNHIAMNEIELYATANSHMALMNTVSPVTAVRREDVLSDVRIIDDEL